MTVSQGPEMQGEGDGGSTRGRALKTSTGPDPLGANEKGGMAWSERGRVIKRFTVATLHMHSRGSLYLLSRCTKEGNRVVLITCPLCPC